jgi:tRNA(Ile)-lysidine synthase
MAGLGPWPENRRVAVGVSGGPDSLCLAWLAKGWGDPVCIIIDHTLRPDSAEEARQAASRLASMGMPSRILTLSGLHPGPGLAARARAARYVAFDQAMGEAGLTDLLLGHHADDQAETVLMRRGAASGPSGLAGMACLVETVGYRIVRPLLEVPTAMLRHQLRQAGIGWVEDPGNSDGIALRSRLRLELAGDPGRSEALRQEARREGEVRAAGDAATSAILARRAALYPEGYALLSPGAIEAPALGALLRGIAGHAHKPRTDAVARLAANPRPATLGGVRLLPAGRLGPGFLLVREASAMQAPTAAFPGTLWDGRFRVGHGAVLPPGAMIGALGRDSAQLRQSSHLPEAVLCTLPALRVAGELVAFSHLATPSVKLWTLSSGGVTLHPSNPVAGAPFAQWHAGDAEAAYAPHLA